MPPYRPCTAQSQPITYPKLVPRPTPVRC
jgi:hypothetical protein